MNSSPKTNSVKYVGSKPSPRIPIMKGKNKHRHTDRSYWMDDSEDEPVYGRSPYGKSPVNMVDEFFSMSYGGETKIEQLRPRNPTQEHYLKLLESHNHPIIISTGPAGCGKSLWACAIGVQKLQQGNVSKLILTRPAVSVDEEHGFLPGTLEEKMDPWIRPLYDVLYKYYTPKQISSLIEKQVIEICPLAYMRGRTFENSWIILDEAQNTLKSQMLMALTRIGKGSKLIVTGDPDQHDRGFESNGLTDLLNRIKKSPQTDIGMVMFKESDIERHPVIQKIIQIYKD